jgi:hypothetical protein
MILKNHSVAGPVAVVAAADGTAVVVAGTAAAATGTAEVVTERGHGHWHGGWWGGGIFIGGLGWPYGYPYPYVGYPYRYPHTVYGAEVVTPSAPTYYEQQPIQREVVYPNGKYVLYGDGVTQAWQWVWIPATLPSPSEPR